MIPLNFTVPLNNGINYGQINQRNLLKLIELVSLP